MKKLLLVILLSASLFTKAQTIEVVLRMPITESIRDEGDSISIVQIALQNLSNIEIKDKAPGVLHKNYKNNPNYIDSSIGAGRCYLIKGQYHYFGLRLKSDIKPEAGDVLSFTANIPTCYQGLLFLLSKNSITLTTVNDNDFYNIETPFLLKTAVEEESYLNKMVNDIKYTAKEMVTQMPEANNPIKEGFYKGKKLFTAMQETTISDLQSFLKYIKARPKNYVANKWKISEIYATWLDAGAPMVIDN